jgi:hypothetical protein
MAFQYPLSALERSRLEAVTTKLVSDAAAEGLTVTAAMLEDLPTVRMATLTDLGLDEKAMDEVRRLVPDQIRKRDLQAALADGESSLSKGIAKMPATSRMTLGHELEAQRQALEAAKSKRQMTAEEEAQALIMLRGISHPATRLAAAREIGLA